MAEISTFTSLVIALCRYQSIDASVFAVIRDIGILGTSKVTHQLLGPFAPGSAEAALHFIVLRRLALPVQVDVLLEGSEKLQALLQILETCRIGFEHGHYLSYGKTWAQSRMQLSILH